MQRITKRQQLNQYFLFGTKKGAYDCNITKYLISLFNKFWQLT